MFLEEKRFLRCTRCGREKWPVPPGKGEETIRTVAGDFGDPYPSPALRSRLRVVDVPPIHTPPLDLVSMTPEFMEAVLGSRFAEATEMLGAALPNEPLDAPLERFLSHRIGQVQLNPNVQQWLARAIVGGREAA